MHTRHFHGLLSARQNVHVDIVGNAVVFDADDADDADPYVCLHINYNKMEKGSWEKVHMLRTAPIHTVPSCC